ncbi:MAG: hypothetical protein KDA89_03940 [Planctomycetaceae bacterium]|nr:hypothetical protein [Planctomycetaceae bacterium]
MVYIWIAVGIVVFCLLYTFVLRPWHMQWGTQGDETTRPLPGDDIVEDPLAIATHGITIRASAEEVWPFLVQIGQDRGGFYSYDWLENLFGCDIHNVEHVVPEYQNLQVDEGVRLHPKAPPLKVIELEKNRVLLIAGGTRFLDGVRDTSFLRLHLYPAYSWVFVLDEQPDRTTRFIARVRARWNTGFVGFCRNRLFLEPAHSIMQRKMNYGLRDVVEAAKRKQAEAAHD